MRALRREHPGWFELGIFLLAYATYFGVRALTEGSVSRAVANALDLVHVERRLDLDWEDAIQGFVLDERALDVFHHPYAYAAFRGIETPASDLVAA